MFENRSFDNLLGRLYQPGEVVSFEGVLGRELSNPIPSWAGDTGGRTVLPYGVAPGMDTPRPDPGEEYPHVNTQLFGMIDPPGNWGKACASMTAPYNAPTEKWRRPTMDGFVADYISTLIAETGRAPGYDEYAQIMTGYTPGQMPVVSTLARGFASFDHWFCEVPSQTFANRSFFHAATSSGFVVNMDPADSFPVRPAGARRLARGHTPAGATVPAGGAGPRRPAAVAAAGRLVRGGRAGQEPRHGHARHP